MPGYPLGIVIEVGDLTGPRDFLVQDLNMPVRVEHSDEVVLDNSSVSIRLVRRPHPRSGTILDLDCSDLESARVSLDGRVGFSCGETRFITTHREILPVATPYGFDLWLGRDHDEDALGFEAPLETNLLWSEDALSVIRGLARQVPVQFRDLMRKKTVGQAETLAAAQGSIDVDRDTAISAAIQVTPEFQLQRLMSNLRSLGVEVERFADEFKR